MADIQQYCGLCLCQIVDENFEIIEDWMKKILDYIFHKQLQDLSNGYKTICPACSEKLDMAYRFKFMCLNTDHIIKRHIYPGTVLPLNIIDIFKKEVEKEELVDDIPDVVCRLCMMRGKAELISLQDMGYNNIEKYIPEVKFSFTSDPVACQSCFNSLQDHIKFIENCLTRQQQPNVSGEAMCVPNEHFKPEMREGGERPGLLEKVFVETDEVKSDRLQNITSERLTDPDMSPVFEVKNQQEPLPRTSQYKSEEHDLQSQSEGRVPDNLQKDKEMSKVKMYKCDKCDYETQDKSNFKRHLLIHKNPSEIKMYKCEYCDYQSKYKADVVKHQLKHADQCQVKMYRCTECDYQSKYKGNVVIHPAGALKL